MTPSIIHAITPGDHYSPRTGSAIPTVVDGLASAAATDPSSPWRHAVVVDASTYRPRYPSAEIIEYDGAAPPSLVARAADAAAGRLGLPRRGAARAWGPLAAALAGRPASVVIGHNALVLPHLLRDTPHRVVLYAHNDLLRTVTRREADRTLGDVAAIVCVSADLAAHTAEQLPPSLASRVHVVDNGVDPARFSPSPRADDEPARPLRVMFAGRVFADKGPDVLVRAAALLPAERFEFTIVGSIGFDRNAPLSPYERSLRKLADESGRRIRFEPFVDRDALPDLLREADAFVVPSRWREPSGLTLGEAMATGLPVIASRVGGIPEVVGDAGILVEPDDPDALAAELRRLADDPAHRTALGRAARARAEERDWSRSWRMLRAVVDPLLQD